MFKTGQAEQIQLFGRLVAVESRSITAGSRYVKLARMRSRVASALRVMTVAGAAWLGLAGTSAAQGFETLGVRALGMGGAFVAVADDATATYWNPAGLATGVIVSAAVEHGREATGEPDAPAFRSSQRGSGTFIGLALPPIGVSYYRVRSTRLLPPGSLGNGLVAAGPTIAPGDQGVAASLVTQHVGLTLVQSLGPFVDVAGTFKYVHGSAAFGNRDGSTGGAAFDRAEDLTSAGSNAFDADLGALVHLRQLRLGVVARNLTEPSFDLPPASHGVRPDALRLDRQVRVGAAWLFADSHTTLSSDVDLTKTVTEIDVRRHVAVGAEHYLLPILAVRGGFRVNTVDDARPAGSAGVSVAVRSIWIDAQVTHGGRLADRAWGVSARMGF
jgi:F plasmid transfer operon, TraF, protein